jgi:hypothetical protein
MTMVSLTLQEVLSQDPLSVGIFKEHNLNPAVIAMLDLKIVEKTDTPIAFDLQAARPTVCFSSKYVATVKDPGELVHKLAHLCLEEGVQHAELFASKDELKSLDASFKSEASPTLETYEKFLPLYRLAFLEPTIGQQYFATLYRKAQEVRKLHPLSFNDQEKLILNILRKVAIAQGSRLYVVGGCIRDKLLGVQNSDLDFMVVTKDLDNFVRTVAQQNNLREPVKLERSQAYTLRIHDIDVDIIDARKVYAPMSQVPEGSLEEDDDWSVALDDIFRRDLTINAIVFDVVNNRVSDPTGRGLRDLQDGVINAIIDPFVKYRINAFDMLRALRFASVYDFKLGPDMMAAMKANAKRITPRDLGGDISNRRILRELRKAAVTANTWFRMKKYLAETGLLDNLVENVKKVETQRTTLSEGNPDK